ncbi:fungal-specific transcription factor domain-containing protein [Umbelopsis sp. PMI_123]|nr:fungal-specific transcription factor domain-containing protein [Umbelopsis sp. PMI_123]
MENTSLSPPPVEAHARQKPSGTKRNKISRACDECRKRKVKCDGAQPCYRCRKSDTTCIFVKSAPRRGPPKQYVELLETRLRMVEKALTFLERSNDEQRIIVDDADDGTKADWDQPRYDSVPTDMYTDMPGPMCIGDIGQALYVDEPYTQDYQLLERTLPHLSDTPMLASFTAIPRELIDTYFEVVHPHFPLLHKSSFYARWNDGNATPSLILLNAMCAVAAVWHRPPLTTPGAPGIQFYQRAFYLIDDYADTPRISTIQALLLLIKYQEYHRRPGFFCRPSLYMQMVVQMWNDLAPMYPPKYTTDIIDLEVGKRTFWMAYIYDVMMSVEQGREPGFVDVEFTTEDPSINTEEDPVEQSLIDHHRWMFQLAKILGSTLKFVRLMASKRKPSVQRTKRQIVEESARFLTCRVNLENFLQSLPASLVYMPSNYEPTYPSAKATLSSSFTAFLHMTYHLAVILLHRTYIMYPLIPLQEIDASYPHREICAASASHITNIVSEFVSHIDSQQFMQCIRGAQHTIHCLTTAITVHSSLMSSPDNDQMAQISKEQYELTLSLLQDIAMESPSLEFQTRFKDAELTLMYGQMAVNPSDTISSPSIQERQTTTSSATAPAIPAPTSTQSTGRQTRAQQRRRNSGPSMTMRQNSGLQRVGSNIPITMTRTDRRMSAISPQPSHAPAPAPYSMLMQSSVALMGNDAASRFAAMFQQQNVPQWRGYPSSPQQMSGGQQSGSVMDPTVHGGSRFLNHLPPHFQRPPAMYEDSAAMKAAMMNSPVPMRTQSATYRMGSGGRAATWSQGTAPNMYQYQQQSRPTSQLQNSVAASDPLMMFGSYSHQLLPTDRSATASSINRSSSNLSLSGNNPSGVGPTPMRTTSSSRASPYSTQRRPATIGHHRRHTISDSSKQISIEGLSDDKNSVSRRRARANTRSQLLPMTYSPLTEGMAQTASTDSGKRSAVAAASGSSSSPSSFSPASDTPSGMMEDSDMALDTHPVSDDHTEPKNDESMMRYLMDEWEPQTPDNN